MFYGGFWSRSWCLDRIRNLYFVCPISLVFFIVQYKTGQDFLDILYQYCKSKKSWPILYSVLLFKCVKTFWTYSIISRDSEGNDLLQNVIEVSTFTEILIETDTTPVIILVAG